jgi:hypothetical protein
MEGWYIPAVIPLCWPLVECSKIAPESAKTVLLIIAGVALIFQFFSLIMAIVTNR